MTRGIKLFISIIFILALFGAGYLFALYLSEKENNENKGPTDYCVAPFS
jgi:hypothetical protein